MRMENPKGRSNYFPSSLDGEGLKTTPEKSGGYHHFPEKLSGVKNQRAK